MDEAQLHELHELRELHELLELQELGTPAAGSGEPELAERKADLRL